jgi:hypothetical protein
LKLRHRDIYDRTQLACSEIDFVSHETDLDTLADNLDDLEVALLDLKDARAKAKPHVSSAFKLERIKLPTFNGDMSEWQSFRDLFESSVHKNTSLSGTEKMVHLKSSLTGEAAALLSSFQATDANYKLAWDAVVKRYHREREIVYAHLRKFDVFKTMSSETSSGLTALADTIEECIRSLKLLKVPVQHWDTIIIYLSVKKLAGETKKQWSLAQEDTLPTKKDFVDFLESRARALADSSPQPIATEKKKTSSHHSTTKSAPVCPMCSSAHYLNKCPTFLTLSTADRQKLVTEKRKCMSCLGSHNTDECRMKWKCLICGGKHHHLLHTAGMSTNTNNSNHTSSFSSATKLNGTSSSHMDSLEHARSVILMGTLTVKTSGPDQVPQRCRVFVDPGSESHFISDECVQRLGLKRKRTDVSITGIAGTSTVAREEVDLELKSLHEHFNLNLTALILPEVTGLMPRSPVRFDWPHLKKLQLADTVYHVPGKIDILLGAQSAASIMMPEIIAGPPGAPIAQRTKFGWMLSGAVEPLASQSSAHVSRQSVPRSDGRDIMSWRHGWYSVPKIQQSVNGVDGMG